MDEQWPTTVGELPDATDADVETARSVQAYPKDELPTAVAESPEVQRLAAIGGIQLRKNKDGESYGYRCQQTSQPGVSDFE